MICHFLNTINIQNEKFWRISLEEFYLKLVNSVRLRRISFFMPSSERIHSPGSYILYGSYTRDEIIDIQQVQNDDGSWEYREIIIHRFRIQRILDTETGKTHAILSVLLVPYKQYSLRYVLYYLHQFYDQYKTQEDHSLDKKAERTFRIWLKWLRDHIMVLRGLGLMKLYRDNWQMLGQWVREIFSDPSGWTMKSLQRLNLALFQDHRMPENTKYRRYARDG